MLSRTLPCRIGSTILKAHSRTFSRSALCLLEYKPGPYPHRIPAGALSKLSVEFARVQRLNIARRLPEDLRSKADTLPKWLQNFGSVPRLVVSGIPTTVKYADLKKELPQRFAEFGSIRLFAIGGSGNEHDGHAYVEYSLPASAAKAMQAYESGGITLSGHSIELAYALRGLEATKVSKMIQARLPGKGRRVAAIDLDSVRDHLEQCGAAPVGIWFGRNTDTAIIQFASTEESQRAMDAYAKSPFLINDKLLDMQYISPRRKNLPAAETQTAPATSTTRIMVSGFGSEDNIHSVRTAFERFGEIQSVYVEKVPGDDNLQVHIEFSTAHQATTAIVAALAGDVKPFPDRKLFVNYSWLSRDPTYKIFVQGFTNVRKDLPPLLHPFTPFVWRVSYRKRDTAAYVEFDTVEHAAAALAALNRKPEVASGALSVHYAVCSPPPQAVIDRFVQLAPPLPAGTDLAMAARLFLEIERNTDWVLDCILPTYLGAKWWSVVLGPRTPNKDRAGAALAATLALKVLRGRETFMRVIPTPRVAEDAHAESAETSPQSDVQPSQDRGSTEALQAAVRACLERSAGDNVNRA